MVSGKFNRLTLCEAAVLAVLAVFAGLVLVDCATAKVVALRAIRVVSMRDMYCVAEGLRFDMGRCKI